MTGAPSPEVRELRFGRAEVRIYAEDTALFAAATDEFLRVAREAIAAEGTCDIALAGGSTPRRLYASVAARAAGIDWSKAHLFFGDERCVPPEHSESNYRMARETLFLLGPVSAAHVHRIRGELPPSEAAKQYEQELRDSFGGTLPRFDLVLLGLGPDGHTASLFPGSAALNERERWVCANWVEKFGAPRITLTYPVLNEAAEVMFLVTGGEKSPAVRQIFREGAALPAAEVQPRGRLLWMLDAAAGAEL